MKISFHGAARTVTGSKHLLHLQSGKKILLDCGMFQGMGRDTLTFNKEWGFEPEQLTYVIISHAHIDHIGLLPKLVKDGYKGKIFITPQSETLAQLLLRDSARIQESDVTHINKQRKKDGRELVEPLYTEEDAQDVFPLFVTVPYNTPTKVDDDIELLYTDCGHILGSAAVNLRIRDGNQEVRVCFSGDIGRYRDILLKSPEVFPQADVIIMESTYGDKRHELVDDPGRQLLDFIQQTCVARKGKLIIPAFSVGRTQELLFVLNRLHLERRLPELPVYVDSPLSIKVTEVVKRHPECFNKHVSQLLERDEDVFAFPGLKYITEVEDSIKLNSMQQPCIIISASGMAEAGRVKHHIANNILDPNSTILIVGYCEPQSLGGKLKAGKEEVRIFGRLYEVRAEVGFIQTMSAHGDYDDMSQWLSCQDEKEVKKLFLVHGEYDVQKEFQQKLIRKGFTDVAIPYRHETIGLGRLQ